MPTAVNERAVTMRWRGKQWDALVDTTHALNVEGSLRSGKTTIALWRELNAMVAAPGIHTFLARWTEDATQSILKPIWRSVLDYAGMRVRWNPLEHYDEFDNGSRAYIRGLKAQDQQTRYGKFRGLTLARVYIDQAEEVPRDIYHELKARLSQKGYAHAITITPQATDEIHWIAKEFPADNSIPHRRYISLSVYDNAHNLDAETIRNLEETYPLGHPKRQTLINGLRGMNVIGDPVYAGAFNRRLHERALAFNPTLPLEEAIDFGKHHPCWVARQVDPFGAVLFLGGIQGEDLFLDDFMRVVTRYRDEWFPDVKELKTCCDPAGSHQSSQGLRQNGVEILRAHYPPRHRIHFQDNSNAPDVRLAMIEELAKAMRQRTPNGEGFGVDDTRWLLVSARRGVSTWKFYGDGLESGYVWAQHLISVAHKPMRQPEKDGWYEHAQNCFSSDTDILTFAGWKSFPSLTAADRLATVNLATDALEYQQPTRLIRHAYTDRLLHLAGKLDALVTPDHRMVVYPRIGDLRYNGPRPGSPREGDEPPIFRRAHGLDRFDRVKLTATWTGAADERIVVPKAGRLGGDVDLDPGDFAEFLGWYVAEGSADKRPRIPGSGYRVCVSQEPGMKADLIDSLLLRLPWRWYRTPHGFQASSQQLWSYVRPLGNKYEKHVPQWVKDAPSAIIRRFLIGAILGDGHINKEGHRQYFSVSQRLADDIQELFLKIGRSASLTQRAAIPYRIGGRSGTNTVPQYHLNEWQSPGAVVRDNRSRSTVTEVPYEGFVYCASVPNSTLIVRRGGRPFVAGNCAEYLQLNFSPRRRPPTVSEPPAGGPRALGPTAWMG